MRYARETHPGERARAHAGRGPAGAATWYADMGFGDRTGSAGARGAGLHSFRKIPHRPAFPDPEGFGNRG